MKFSIVTPSYNSEKYIQETIESILSQKGDFEIEYIIADGGSTDKTISIIKSYEEKLSSGSYPIACKNVVFRWFSEKDRGMYDAVNKGLSRATGDIYAYLNSDDLYVQDALEKMRRVFEKFPDIVWVKGITSFIESPGKIEKGVCYIYNQDWIVRGIYGRNAHFIHQDSVFWKRGLWEKVGKIDTEFRLAGDYYLWLQFATYAPLWSLKAPISYFRMWEGQQTHTMEKYRIEQKRLSIQKGLENRVIKLFFWLKAKLPQPFLNPFFDMLYRLLFPNRNKYYIDLDGSNNPTKKPVSSYIAR